jgi:hypothetical protein
VRAQVEQAQRKKDSDARRMEAAAAAQKVSKVLVESLNEGEWVKCGVCVCVCVCVCVVCVCVTVNRTPKLTWGHLINITHFMAAFAHCVLGVAAVFTTQKQLELEAKHLQTSLNKYTKL